MKQTIALILSLLFTQVYSQFNFDCSKTFFSADNVGIIQQWTLQGDSISGGDTLLTHPNTGIAFCGSASNPTFYTTHGANDVIDNYDLVGTWNSLSTWESLYNIGGHNFTMFAQLGSSPTVYHFEGNTITQVVMSTNLNVADIAVDTNEIGWNITYSNGSYKVFSFDQNGLIDQFPIDSFGLSTTYGSFFLNDTLYLAQGLFGQYPESILQISINADSAWISKILDFPFNNYMDLASCQTRVNQNTSLEEEVLESFKLFPNPTKGKIFLQFKSPIESLIIYNSSGQIVFEDKNTKQVNIGDFEDGVYTVRVQSQHEFIYRKIIVLK